MRVLLKNVTYFDGEKYVGGKYSIVLENGKISDITKIAIADSDFDSVYDCEGKTVLPGLIDCHANIVGLTTAEQVQGITEKTVASSTMRGIKEGEKCIRAGVTSIRVDTTGHHGIYALRDAFDSGMFLGPHMVVPGRAICTTCGHGWNFGNHVADGPAEIRKAVRQEIMSGADWIKLMITGGAGTKTERIEDKQMSREEITAAIDEAHSRGRHVFAHLTVDKAINESLDAGIDSVEHGIIMEKNTAERMAELGTWYVPTLAVYRRLVEQGEKGLVPDYMYKKSLAIVKRHSLSFKYALDAGVKMATGTDSGQTWFPLGESLWKEMEIMNQEGMPVLDVLRCATSNAARLLEKNEIGRIAVGANADILILDKNPLDCISNIRSTYAVIKDGIIVYKKS